MSDYFEAIEPMDKPNLPDVLRARGAEGLLPGQIVFPHVYDVLVQDEDTGELYVRLDREIDEDAHDPRYMSRRFGLMRVFMESEGSLLDGFVADLRFEGASEIMKSDVEHYREFGGERYQPLAGIVYADMDQRPRFRGRPEYTEAAAGLARTVDDRLLDDESQRYRETEPTDTEWSLGGVAVEAAAEDDARTLPEDNASQDNGGAPQAKQGGLFRRRRQKKDDR